jgi:hypothetical protein
MVNSLATFNRMMRKLLAGCDFVDNYVDDMIGHTATWTEHMTMLRELLQRLAEAELTIKPSKCYIGYNNIGFTGHMVGMALFKWKGKSLKESKKQKCQRLKDKLERSRAS